MIDMSELNKVYFLSLSGGMDSTIAGLKILENVNNTQVFPIFINYGQKSVDQEWISVQKVMRKMKEYFECKEILIVDPIRINLKKIKGYGIFDWSESMLITGNEESPYLENRNMILLSIIASFAEEKINEKEKAIIITGFRGGYEDTSQSFVEAINNVFNVLSLRVRVEAPIINYENKALLLKEHSKYSEFWDLTWSCYKPVEGNPCGKCPACKDRAKALHMSE